MTEAEQGNVADVSVSLRGSRETRMGVRANSVGGRATPGDTGYWANSNSRAGDALEVALVVGVVLVTVRASAENLKLASESDPVNWVESERV